MFLNASSRWPRVSKRRSTKRRAVQIKIEDESVTENLAVPGEDPPFTDLTSDGTAPDNYSGNFAGFRKSNIESDFLS